MKTIVILLAATNLLFFALYLRCYLKNKYINKLFDHCYRERNDLYCEKIELEESLKRERKMYSQQLRDEVENFQKNIVSLKNEFNSHRMELQSKNAGLAVERDRLLTALKTAKEHLQRNKSGESQHTLKARVEVEQALR